ALRDAAYRSKADFALELKRVKSNSKKELSLTVDDLPVFCDAAMYYDIWFKKDDTPQKEDEQNA
ncbi:MAG: hypothetical protein LBI54_10745, partial [Lachnospiraceae bacterium]|nr:hypothetical protein [Lachnospiraceae bacterium]